MRAHYGLGVVRQMTRDTFRQACASGVCWIMLAVTGVCAALCLSVSVSGDVALRDGDEPAFFLPEDSTRARLPGSATGPEGGLAIETDPGRARREGVETVRGRVSLGFGAVSFPVSRERGDAVRFLQLLLAWGAAGTLGLLMALIWTAGFIPALLDPRAASILLAKPAPRWQLLLGKYLGVLAFVGAQIFLFVGLTWLGLGVRTGVWDLAYWWSAPVLLLQFAVFYSASALLGVVTRSTVACAFGSVLFWLLAWGVNYGRIMARALPAPHALPRLTLAAAEAAYAACPKPIDVGLILFNALDARHHFAKPTAFALLESSGWFSPSLTIVSSLALAGVLLAVSAYEFAGQDY